MARLNENPVKPALSGAEGMSATDPSTNLDVGVTPWTITQFVVQNGQLANGSNNGLMSGAQATQLAALPSPVAWGQFQALAKLTMLPAFFASPPSSGNVQFFINPFQNVIQNTIVCDDLYTLCSAGSTNIVFTVNGTPFGGSTSVTTSKNYAPGPTGLNINPGDIVGVTFTGTTGNCANAIISLGAHLL